MRIIRQLLAALLAARGVIGARHEIRGSTPAQPQESVEKDDAQHIEDLLHVIQSGTARFFKDEQGMTSAVSSSSPERVHMLIRVNSQANTLIKETKENVEGMENALQRLAVTLRDQAKGQKNEIKELSEVRNENQQLKTDLDQDSRLKALVDEYQQLKADKAQLLSSVQTLLHQSKARKVKDAVQLATRRAEEEDAKSQDKYTARISELMKQAQDMREQNKKLEGQITKAKEELSDNQARDGEQQEDDNGMKETIKSLEEEQTSLVNDKGKLMKSLRSFLSQNNNLAGK